MTLRRVHRGIWSIRVPEKRSDLFYVYASRGTGGGAPFAFCGTHRELVALRTALAAALTLPKGTP